MAHHQPFSVVGYHSCDREVGLKVLNGEMQLNPSNNPWDWLGYGVYFWEQSPDKALHYAEKCARGKQKYNGRIKNPFVIGAIIELGNCLNIVEPNSIGIVKAAHKGLDKIVRELGFEMPVNNGSNRKLDCATIQYVHHSNNQENIPSYDTVRSPFQEGEAIYPTSAFTEGLLLK